MASIVTERLILRRPVAADRPALDAMWGDPVVMRDLGPTLDAAGVEALLARHAAFYPEGLGFNVVERRADGAVIGFAGLRRGNPGSPIAGLVEVGWLLARAHWGHGYAAEAAQASLDWSWANLAEDRIIAITATRNLNSRRLMERIGMTYLTDGDFDHPNFAEGDPLRRTVTYAIDRPA